jgi:hypothetical protein
MVSFLSKPSVLYRHICDTLSSPMRRVSQGEGGYGKGSSFDSDDNSLQVY